MQTPAVKFIETRPMSGETAQLLRVLALEDKIKIQHPCSKQMSAQIPITPAPEEGGLLGLAGFQHSRETMNPRFRRRPRLKEVC